MKRWSILGVLVATMLTMPPLTACGGGATGDGAAGGGGAGGPVTAPTETLKIGAVVWSGWSLGSDLQRGCEIMAELDNAAGGIDIGGTKYKVELTFIESNNDQTQTMSAVDQLLSQDEVDFLITDSMYIGSVLAETEKNQVVCVSGSPVPAMFDPTFKYSFQCGFMFQGTREVAGWIAENVEGLTTVDLACPDDESDIAYAEGIKAILEDHGLVVKSLVYPGASGDLSSLGMEVMADNPSGFIACSGTNGLDSQAYAAVVAAGYQGQLFSTSTATYESLKAAVPEATLEGFIGAAWPVEFDPPATEVAAEFKEAYIARNGLWDGPEIQLTGAYAALRAALVQAGTTAADAVATALSSGLEFEGPTGKGRMIPRNDLGISATLDSISQFCIKKIENGAPVLVHTITLEEGQGYLAPGVLE
jgi:branched-chain amino acid transport system substrate-binding protein